MKQAPGVVLFFILTIACVFACALYRESRPMLSQDGRQSSASTMRAENGRVSDNQQVEAPKSSPSTTEPTQRTHAGAQKSVEAAPHGKPKPAPVAPSKSDNDMETAGLPESSGGGGEVKIAPANNCVPDAFIVQPCSFEDWTYTFPED